MITINGQETSFITNFNDGTKQIRFPQAFNRHNLGPDLLFTWLYDSDEELVNLLYLVKYFRTTDYMFDNSTYMLKIPYLPNARMDRVQEFFSTTDKSNPKEVFTLKFFCEFINSLGFDKIITFDVHSNTALGLLNNCEDWTPDSQIRNAIKSIKSETGKEVIIAVPDTGAYRRYSGLSCLKGLEAISGIKVRDWHTRKIQSLNLMPITPGIEFSENLLSDKAVLVIDDIVSTGGTISRMIDKIKSELGANDIFIYCSHLENTALDKNESKILDKIENGAIKKIYTTNSIFRKNSDSVRIISRF